MLLTHLHLQPLFRQVLVAPTARHASPTFRLTDTQRLASLEYPPQRQHNTRQAFLNAPHNPKQAKRARHPKPPKITFTDIAHP